MSFSNFYKTRNTREHQQSQNRSQTRKHLNWVPYSKSVRKEDPLVDKILKNKRPQKIKINKLKAEQLAKTYNLNLDKENKPSFTKSLNRTNIKLHKNYDNYYVTYNP
jgi:hypothetical protein